MTIAFSVAPEFEEKLAWIRAFVAEDIEPLDFGFEGEHVIYDKSHPVHERIVRPLQDRARQQGLWACHLRPELGGQGYGQVQLALMNEILGRSGWAPAVFGCQAPDSGNAEILAHCGTSEQKARYLQPLLDGRITSFYSMTEPDGGSDPQRFTCSAVRDGDDWVLHAAWVVSRWQGTEEADQTRLQSACCKVSRGLARPRSDLHDRRPGLNDARCMTSSNTSSGATGRERSYASAS